MPSFSRFDNPVQQSVSYTHPAAATQAPHPVSRMLEIPTPRNVLADHALGAAVRTIFQVAQPHAELDAGPHAEATNEPPLSRNWRPFMAAAYGLLSIACLWFLAAGFTLVHHLLAALIVGNAGISFLVLTAVAALASWPIARKQLDKLGSEKHVRQHLLWIVGISLVLLLPVTQHLTFGAPAPKAPAAQATQAPGPKMDMSHG